MPFTQTVLDKSSALSSCTNADKEGNFKHAVCGEMSYFTLRRMEATLNFSFPILQNVDQILTESALTGEKFLSRLSLPIGKKT